MAELTMNVMYKGVQVSLCDFGNDFAFDQCFANIECEEYIPESVCNPEDYSRATVDSDEKAYWDFYQADSYEPEQPEYDDEPSNEAN